MDLKPNTLYQYKGGGYDGCFWEWNYAVIDDDGNFIDIYSSGHRGCRSKKELAGYQPLAFGNGAYTYDLNDPVSLNEFVIYSNAGSVVAVAKIIFTKLGIVMPAICYDCGNTGPAHEMYATKFRGAGGVVSVATKKVCPHCIEKHQNDYH